MPGRSSAGIWLIWGAPCATTSARMAAPVPAGNGRGYAPRPVTACPRLDDDVVGTVPCYPVEVVPTPDHAVLALLCPMRTTWTMLPTVVTSTSASASAVTQVVGRVAECPDLVRPVTRPGDAHAVG